jgi:hypothetical protein
MDTMLKLLYAVTITALLVSCGGDSAPEDAAKKEMTSPQPIAGAISSDRSTSIMAATAASFSFDREKKVISNFTFDKVECRNDLTLCKELMKLAGGNTMSFTASGDASYYEGNVEFSRKVAGVFMVDKKELKANLLFTIRPGEEGAISFSGMLTFKNESTFKYATDEVSIRVKGRK